MTKYYLLFLFFLSSCASNELKTIDSPKLKIEILKITTEDKQTELTAFLSKPKDTKVETKLPLVIMVPGTGLFDADVFFGESKTDKDLIFLDLSHRLNKLGFAILRYNYRGVYCNKTNQPKCSNCETKEQKRSHLLKSCFDSKAREKVTSTNTQEDILTLYKKVLELPQIDKSKIIFFGHSEGSLNISRLIEKNK